MTTVTITHTPADGTTLTGDPRPHHGLVKSAGFRWSPRQRFWCLPNSRDRWPDVAHLGNLVAQLEAAGVTVDLEPDFATRATADVEADRRDRLEARAEGLGEKAARLDAQADVLFDRAHAMADVIPFGQPILVGHHSEGRDRAYRARMRGPGERAVATFREAQETERRAEASAANLAHRESAPVTLRRIEKLLAERRGIERQVAGELCITASVHLKAETHSDDAHEWRCRYCDQDLTVTDRLVPDHYGELHRPASGAYLERLTVRLAEVDDQVAYWREHLASLEARGVKLWGPADFKKGDVVVFKYGGRHQAVVLRVNAKSVTVRHPSCPEGAAREWTVTVPWDDVRGRIDPDLTCPL